MKIDPVYVVAPEPEPEGSSRRHWLMGVGLVILGAATGALLGYRAGQTWDSASEELTGEGSDDGLDPELRRLRAVVRRGAADELHAERWSLLLNLSSRFPDDAILWQGFDRLVEMHLQAVPTESVRELLLYAAAILEHQPGDRARERRHLLPALRRR